MIYTLGCSLHINILILHNTFSRDFGILQQVPHIFGLLFIPKSMFEILENYGFSKDDRTITYIIHLKHSKQSIVYTTFILCSKIYYQVFLKATNLGRYFLTFPLTIYFYLQKIQIYMTLSITTLYLHHNTWKLHKKSRTSI